MSPVTVVNSVIVASWANGSCTRGTQVSSTATFALAGVSTDPTTITVRLRSPLGGTVVAVYPAAGLTRTSAGVYVFSYDTTPSNGEWVVRWEGTGAVLASVEDPSIVYSSL